MDRATNDRIARVFAAQAAAATTRQLCDAGLTRGQLARRVRDGLLAGAAPRVWTLAGSATTWEQALWVAVLAAGPTSVVSHRSAAALYGLDGFGPGPIDITVPRARRNAAPAVKPHSAMRLERPDIAWVQNFRATSAARTIIDLAALADISATQLGNALDSAARLGLSTAAYVSRRLDAIGCPGRAGVHRLREVMLDAGTHSFLERRFLGLTRDAGLPRPRAQVVHRANGRTIARVDFEWTDHRVIAEVNGRRGHASDRERTKDARRRNELQGQGFVVLEFTTTMVIDSPAGTVANLRRHLAGIA